MFKTQNMVISKHIYKHICLSSHLLLFLSVWTLLRTLCVWILFEVQLTLLFNYNAQILWHYIFINVMNQSESASGRVTSLRVKSRDFMEWNTLYDSLEMVGCPLSRYSDLGAHGLIVKFKMNLCCEEFGSFESLFKLTT